MQTLIFRKIINIKRYIIVYWAKNPQSFQANDEMKMSKLEK